MSNKPTKVDIDAADAWARRLFGDPVTPCEFRAIRHFHETVDERIRDAVKADRVAIKSLIDAVTTAHNMGDPDVLLYSNKDVAGILENIAAIIDGMEVSP